MIEVIRDHRLEGRVVFIGEVDDPDPFYEMADIMTFPSHLEGFGSVVVEAMAHGLPVIVRHLPGVNDVFVKEAETGFLFDTAEEFNEAVHKLSEDPALRQKIGRAARRLAIEQFGLMPIAKQYFMIYGVSWCAAPADDAQSAATIDTLDRVAATLPASTSIIDPRFRTAIALPADQRPLLVTTVDAEEDFDWSGPFLRSANDVKSMARQHLAHHIFDRYGVVPTYLVDFPVASQAQGYEPLLDYLRDGKCEIGTQLHPWVNPPFVEDITVANSFAGNLRLGLEFEKLRVLTETIEEAFRMRPRVYRAGRYGVGRRTGDILKFLGYHVDTSVVPNYGFVREGGPNFFGFPTDPYWINAERTVLELPISSALVGPLVPAPWLTKSIYTATLVRTIFPPLLSRSGLMDRIDLTPEGITGLEAKKLVRALLARGTRVFTLAYHSSSLLPGSTPYVRTAADLDRFLGW